MEHPMNKVQPSCPCGTSEEECPNADGDPLCARPQADASLEDRVVEAITEWVGPTPPEHALAAAREAIAIIRSGPQTAMHGMPDSLGDIISIDEMTTRLERRGAELNISPNGQLMLKAAFYIRRLASHVDALALSRPRAPKVRTSHHRNKEEAARLQALVDEKYTNDEATSLSRPH